MGVKEKIVADFKKHAPSEKSKDATTLEAEALEKTKAYRFQEQCFLNFNRNLLYGKMIDQVTQSKYISDITKGPTIKTTESLGERGLLDNDHVVSLLSKDPSALISKLSKIDGAHMFFRLDAPIFSQLKPIVEMYKLYPHLRQYDESSSTFHPPFRGKMPIGENIPFGDEGWEGHPKAKYKRQESSAIERQIFQPQGSLGNAMLRDLRFAFAGRNVAEINTIEKVNFHSPTSKKKNTGLLVLIKG